MRKKVKINGTKFGEITINGKPYDSDVTVYWDGKVDYRQKEHVIEATEFVSVLRADPEIVVIGTGDEGVVRVAPEVNRIAENKKVKIYAEKTSKAYEIFNAFAHQRKKVVGIFHVTC
ncbi:MAG: hypothetical protein JSV63_02145 [Candidatus Aenigmatarchaeota archaeon]|nr:MAG: hypothetical protein JSV63_02145 [Candidatus Aenigmarchaeota archaeon]